MLKSKTQKKSLGFTLVELLVVISIVAILTGIILNLLNSGGVRKKARDSQRVTDLSTIQTALELYFADHRRYPVSNFSVANCAQPGDPGTPCDGGEEVIGHPNSGITPALEPSYINSIPRDPSGKNEFGSPTICFSGAIGRYRYVYHTGADSGTYNLSAIMELETSNDGNECGCGGAEINNVCYRVTNP